MGKCDPPLMDYTKPYDPPPHSHYRGQPLSEYPLRDNPPCPAQVWPGPNCPTQPCPDQNWPAQNCQDQARPEQFSSAGKCTGSQAERVCGAEVGPKCDVLPPPIPPVRYVPGLDVQEQLSTMANHVNTCIDRWNKIQANCYQALHEVVGAAVQNDVYYDHQEVRFSEGFSAPDGAAYELVEARPVDRCGQPIIMRLMTAYNAGSGTARENIESKSFVTSATAIVTARMSAWSGLCMVGGNPVSTREAMEDTFYAGWNDHGKLIIMTEQEATIENACRRHIVDLIGPVFPIVQHGKKTYQVSNFSGSSTPAAIQAIGYKRCNGNKVMFSCGFQSEPGCTPDNVAELLIEMGVTEAVITCLQTEYGSADISSLPVEKKVEPGEGVEVQAETTTPDGSELGLTGGMCYIGQLTDNPLQFQTPQNCAFWVITKRPICGWNNRFTATIADIAQRLGITENELAAVNGKIDIEMTTILNIQKRVGILENNDKQQDTTLELHSTQINQLQIDMNKAQTDILNLENDVDLLDQRMNKVENDVNTMRTELTNEIAARNAADQNLINALQNEANTRATADQYLQSQIDGINVNYKADLAEEKAEREAADKELQDLLDALSGKVNFSDGPGIVSKFLPGGIRQISAHIGAGLRFDTLNRIAVDTGPGIGVVGGKIVPLLSECFTINEKGEITMACCGTGNQVPQAGVGLSYTADPTTGEQVLNVDPPKNGEIGGVKAGAGITISADGTISANGGGSGGGTAYELPPATETTLGGVIVGENLTVDETGKVSAPDPYELPIATPEKLGGIRVGQNLTIDQNGVLNAQVPDISEVGNGDTVLAGTGIDIVKDSAENTATISLSETTQSTLAQVGDNKAAIDALTTDQKKYVLTSTYTAGQAAQDAQISKALGDAASAQTQAAQISADLEQVSDAANNAQTAANNAQTTANNNTTEINTIKDALQNLSFEVPVATTESAGVVKIGSGLTVQQDGTLSANETPSASTTVKGVVKIGSGINVAADGTISVPAAVKYDAGTGITIIDPDGGNLSINLSAETQQTLSSAKSTADSALATANAAMPKSGGEFTGNISMGNNVLTVPTPTANNQAANRATVAECFSSAFMSGITKMSNVFSIDGSVIKNPDGALASTPINWRFNDGVGLNTSLIQVFTSSLTQVAGNDTDHIVMYSVGQECGVAGTLSIQSKYPGPTTAGWFHPSTEFRAAHTSATTALRFFVL